MTNTFDNIKSWYLLSKCVAGEENVKPKINHVHINVRIITRH